MDHAKTINEGESGTTIPRVTVEDWVGPDANTAQSAVHFLRGATHAIKEEMIRRKLITQNDGYEYWLNINKQQNYHYDCDEGLRQKYGILRFPIVSTVFYISCPTEREGKKGSLILHKATNNVRAIYDLYNKKEDHLSTESQIITPKENRLVFFPPRIPHKVESWEEGKRISLAVNFWQHRPLEENYSDQQLLRTLLRMQIDQ